MMRGFVYFIGTEWPSVVKIGWAVNPRARLATLQTGHPETLRIHALTRGSTEDERRLHGHFRSVRARGEWFLVGLDLRMLMILLGADHLDFDPCHTEADVGRVAALYSELVDRRVDGPRQRRRLRRLMQGL